MQINILLTQSGQYFFALFGMNRECVRNRNS